MVGDFIMRKDLAEVVLIVDRSQSMYRTKKSAEDGANEFIDSQKDEEGNCKFTLIDFNHDVNYVNKRVDVNEVSKYKLQPRGMTALYDAIGTAVTDLKNRYVKTRKKDRPGLVSFTIITDGLENRSYRFTKNQISCLIKECESKYGWKFNYLGSNQIAEDVAKDLGINEEASATYIPGKTEMAFTLATQKVKEMRKATIKNEIVMCGYSEEEKLSVK